jgi:hypothetical protein
MIRTFINHDNGDSFRFKFRRSFFSGRYVIDCLSHPPCPYPMGVSAHMEDDRRLSVHVRVDTLERAKAIALVWMRGFSHYSRTGVMPNDATRVNGDGAPQESISREGV